MKQFFKSFIIFILIALLFTKSNAQEKIKSGFYFLAEKKGESISAMDADSTTAFAIEKNIALGVKDFSYARRTTLNTEMIPKECIEIRFTKPGMKKWFFIKKRCVKTKESVVFIIDNKIFCTYSFYFNRSFNNSTIYLILRKQYLEKVFEMLNIEITERK